MATTLHPSLASPRSSTSSVSTTTTAALGPLTPGWETGEGVVKMVNPDGAAVDTDEEGSEVPSSPTPMAEGIGKGAVTPSRPARKAADEPPAAQFAAFSFGGASTSIPRPQPSPTGPQKNFSFGTCPADFLGTPTAEMGQFEYPVNPFSERGMEEPPTLGSARSSLSRAMPLGESHRRGSIIARPSHSRSSSGHSLSPPPTRRSSTASSIATVPAAGHRPSILHSASAALGQPSLTPITLPLDPRAPPPLLAGPAVPSNPASRRGSILFQPKTLPSPVPPSLLARRGSLPAAQLFGLPPDQHITLPANLALFPGAGANRKGSISTYPTGGHTTSTHALYHRRESTFSEASTSGASSSSSQQTVREGEGGLGRRASLKGISGSPSMSSQGYDHGARRASLPQLPHLPREGPLFTGRLPARPASPATSSPSVGRSPRASVSFLPSASAGTGEEHAAGPGAGAGAIGGALADQRRRRSSARHSLLASGGALSSSEESEEAEASDGLADLPTPELDSARSFTNPWAGSSSASSRITMEDEDGVDERKAVREAA